jgi:hypothetical protein
MALYCFDVQVRDVIDAWRCDFFRDQNSLEAWPKEGSRHSTLLLSCNACMLVSSGELGRLSRSLMDCHA